MTKKIKNYKPAKKDVLKQMSSDLFSSNTIQSFTRGTGKVATSIGYGLTETGKALGYLTGYATSGTVTTFIAPFAIPTAVRKFTQLGNSLKWAQDPWWVPKREGQKILAGLGGLYGVVFGSAAGISSQILLYISLYDQGHEAAWTLPLVTNAVSGVYELFRKGYKKAETKLLTQGESLPNNTK